MKLLRALPIALAFLLVVMVASPVSAAVPDGVKEVSGTPIVVGDCSGDYAAGFGGCVTQITLASLGASAARQSVKINFGDNREQRYSMQVSVVKTSAGTSGPVVDYYIAPSTSCTAGTNNSGGTTGTDAAYSGHAGGGLTASLKQLMYIGALVSTADGNTVVQRATVGQFRVPTQCANLVVVNNMGVTFHTSDADIAVQILPIGTQIQE
jgi:hypothetical protein